MCAVQIELNRCWIDPSVFWGKKSERDGFDRLAHFLFEILNLKFSNESTIKRNIAVSLATRAQSRALVRVETRSV